MRRPHVAYDRFRRLGGCAGWLAALLTVMAIGAPSPPEGRAAIIEQLLAVVNGKTIALSDLRRYQLLFAPDVPPEQALQQMIDDQLLLAEAVRFDIEPPPAAQVRQALKQLEQKAGGPAGWEAALRREHLDADAAEQAIIEHLRARSLLSQRVDQFVIVTRTEVEAVFDDETEGRYRGKTLDEAAEDIERELTQAKTASKRQDYLGRLRAHATITVVTDTPGAIPAEPSSTP